MIAPETMRSQSNQTHLVYAISYILSLWLIYFPFDVGIRNENYATVVAGFWTWYIFCWYVNELCFH